MFKCNRRNDMVKRDKEKLMCQKTNKDQRKNVWDQNSWLKNKVIF